MTFLEKLFHEENYSCVLFIVCCALPAILPRKQGNAFRQDETRSHIMKGTFKLRPT